MFLLSEVEDVLVKKGIIFLETLHKEAARNFRDGYAVVMQ